MKKLPIRDRRIKALYHYKVRSSSSNQKELLEFFMAAAPHSLIKEAVEHFNIKVD